MKFSVPDYLKIKFVEKFSLWIGPAITIVLCSLGGFFYWQGLTLGELTTWDIAQNDAPQSGYVQITGILQLDQALVSVEQAGGRPVEKIFTPMVAETAAGPVKIFVQIAKNSPLYQEVLANPSVTLQGLVTPRSLPKELVTQFDAASVSANYFVLDPVASPEGQKTLGKALAISGLLWGPIVGFWMWLFRKDKNISQ